MLSNPNEVTVNNIVINTRRAQKVLAWLIQREAENVRTGERGETKMIQDIQIKCTPCQGQDGFSV